MSCQPQQIQNIYWKILLPAEWAPMNIVLGEMAVQGQHIVKGYRADSAVVLSSFMLLHQVVFQLLCIYGMDGDLDFYDNRNIY